MSYRGPISEARSLKVTYGKFDVSTILKVIAARTDLKHIPFSEAARRLTLERCTEELKSVPSTNNTVYDLPGKLSLSRRINVTFTRALKSFFEQVTMPSFI